MESTQMSINEWRDNENVPLENATAVFCAFTEILQTAEH